MCYYTLSLRELGRVKNSSDAPDQIVIFWQCAFSLSNMAHRRCKSSAQFIFFLVKTLISRKQSNFTRSPFRISRLSNLPRSFDFNLSSPCEVLVKQLSLANSQSPLVPIILQDNPNISGSLASSTRKMYVIFLFFSVKTHSTLVRNFFNSQLWKSILFFLIWNFVI